MKNIFNELSAPFDPADVSWRIGSTTKDKSRGMALAYVDARIVQDRLNDVLTPLGWQCRHEVSRDKRVTCHIGVKAKREYLANDQDGFGHSISTGEPEEWIWKSDGAGETDFEGEKGSYSDSFKRAAVKWGVGRYLYDMGSPWVEIENNRIKESELPKLNALLQDQMADVKLVATAVEKSNAGIEIYKAFFTSITEAQRKVLAPHHEKLKSNAQSVSNNPKQQKAA